MLKFSRCFLVHGVRLHWKAHVHVLMMTHSSIFFSVASPPFNLWGTYHTFPQCGYCPLNTACVFWNEN